MGLIVRTSDLTKRDYAVEQALRAIGSIAPKLRQIVDVYTNYLIW